MRSTVTYRLVLSVLIISTLSVITFSIIPNAFAWGRPKDLDLSGVSCPGNPTCSIYRLDMAAEGNYVHLIYMDKSNEGLYYHRGTTNADGSVAWERGRLLATGVSPGNDGIAIAADNTGTIHIAYSNDKRLYYIKNAKQGDLGNWTSPELIDSAHGQRIVQVALALDTDRTPYVAWGQGINPAYLHYAYRPTPGNWKSDQINASRQYLHSNLRMAVTGSGTGAVIHIFADTQRRQTDQNANITYARVARSGSAKVANWSYSFANARDSDKFPYVTVDPVTNYIYAGYVDGTRKSGYRWVLSTSTDDGSSWAQPFNVRPYGSGFWGDYTSMIAYNGTVYMMIAVKQMDGEDVSKWGFADVRYSQPTNALIGSPQAILNYADSNGKIDRFTGYAISTNARVGTWIRNYVDGPGYNSDPGGIEPIWRPIANLTLNGGASITKDPNLAVTLTNLIGTRENLQMRVAVDRPVTDATPLQAFADTFTVPVSNLSQCTHTVYVQIVDTVKGLVSDVLSANIIVDNQVQADVQIRNPYLRSNSVVFSNLEQSNGPLVTDGDANYTRVANFYIEVNGASECTQLASVSVGRSATPLLPPTPINAKFFANVMPIPGQLVVGSNPIVINVSDSISNTQTYSREIKYDPTPPTLVTTGTLEINVPTSGPNILATLVVSGSEVTDNLYPGRGFWGVVVANSRTAVTNPITDTTLVWQTVKANGTAANFTLSNWSLLGGLTADQQTPGDYYVYVRFIDGAGNATNGFLVNKANLITIVKPTTSLPIVVHP